MSVALVCCASGEPYLRYAADLLDSAQEFFDPGEPLQPIQLSTRCGWPDATLYRYAALLNNSNLLTAYDYVYLCDADMIFEAPVGEEILGDLVATQHPGFVGAPRSRRPYERRPESRAHVRSDEGDAYYAGGFVGGRRNTFLILAARIAEAVYADAARNVTAIWHDESHLNRALIDTPPTVTLPPSYCYPDDDSGYNLAGYERKLVALDKTPAERSGR